MLRVPPSSSSPLTREALWRALRANLRPTASTAEEALAAVASLVHRPPGTWMPHRREALLQAIRDAPPGPLVLPSLGDPLLREVGDASGRPLLFLPTDSKTGLPSEEGLSGVLKGAGAVISEAPWGVPPPPLLVETALREGAWLIEDVTRAVGARLEGAAMGSFGHRTILPLFPSPDSLFPDTLLLGEELPPVPQLSSPGRSLLPLLSLTVRTAARDPRLHRLFPSSWLEGADRLAGSPRVPLADPAFWPVILDAARGVPLASSQRATHYRSLEARLHHAPGVDLLTVPHGVEPSPLALPLLTARGARLQSALLQAGIASPLLPLADLSRGACPVTARLLQRLVFLPIVPHYRPRDLAGLAERARRALAASRNQDGGGARP